MKKRGRLCMEDVVIYIRNVLNDLTQWSPILALPNILFDFVWWLGELAKSVPKCHLPVYLGHCTQWAVHRGISCQRILVLTSQRIRGGHWCQTKKWECIANSNNANNNIDIYVLFNTSIYRTPSFYKCMQRFTYSAIVDLRKIPIAWFLYWPNSRVGPNSPRGPSTYQGNLKSF